MNGRKLLDLGIWTACATAVALLPCLHIWHGAWDGQDPAFVRCALKAAAPAVAAVETAAASAEPAGGTTLLHLFQKGGPIMWPLLLASVIALSVAIERTVFLFGERNRRNEAQLNDFFGEVGRGNIEGAVALARHSQDAIVSTLGYGLEHRDESLAHALSFAETRTLKRYRRGIGVLDTVITLAPLLGLLGTVTGMMGSFSMIGGQVGAPSAITGGIAEALIATAFGLCIAIASLLPFNWLNNCVEQLETDLREAGDHLKQRLEGRRAELPPCLDATCHACGGTSEPLRLAVPAAGAR